MRKKAALWFLVGFVGAAIVACFLTPFVYGLLYPYSLPRSDWSLFKKRFISPEGRVIDTGNENVSHSEGQGYGLLIAVAYEDRRTFDLIWNWTQKNLQTRPNDKLLSWLWKPSGPREGAVSDPNNASDGDILVAWGLLRAHRLWKEYRYQQAAAQILADLARLDLRDGPDGRLYLLPGTDGFVEDSGVTLNPSYYVFPALDDIARVFPDQRWKELVTSGEALIEKARFGKWQLIPDWVVDADSSIAISPKFPPDFGYNAVRVPLHIAWHNPRSPLLDPFAAFWKPLYPGKIPATVNLQNDSFGVDPALPGMRAIAAFSLACNEKRSLTVRSIPELTKGDSYFSASLSLLTKIAVRDSFANK